MRKSSTKN